jgi:phenylpropionate dioxygenase-like ring-hydroxylating dioxygenase large terminal subunit
MFLAEDEDLSILRPSSSLISASDWEILSRFWYPVAVEGDVKQAPMKGRLLDVELVIYRTEGHITVARDRCPHRHTLLSAGRIVEDRLVCPMHGLSFNASGRCTRIPALGRETSIPARYRLRTFRSEVRYGLVWTCLDDTGSQAIPNLHAATTAGADHLAYALVRDWPVSAPRQVENFFDLAHIPFVHARTMGTDPNAAVPTGHVSQTIEGLVVTGIARERRMFTGEIERVDMTYTIVLPFIVELKSHMAKDGSIRLHMYNITAPTSAYESRVFMMFITDRPSPSKESQPARDEGDAIILEDIAIMRELAQQKLPLDQKQEIHLPMDLVSLEYRKRLRAIGLGRRQALAV